MRIFKPLIDKEELFLTPEFISSVEDTLNVKVDKVYTTDDGKINKVRFRYNLPFGNFTIRTVSPRAKCRVYVIFSGYTLSRDNKLNQLGRFFHTLFNDEKAILHFNSLSFVPSALQSMFDLWELFRTYERVNNDYNNDVNLLKEGVHSPNPQLRLMKDGIEVNTRFVEILSASAFKLFNARKTFEEYMNKWHNDMRMVYDSSYL